MPLGNIVMLKSGIPERMHFASHIIEKRTITDPRTGNPALRNVLVFDVDRYNGQPSTAKFSTMAEKLYGKLEAYLSGQLYRGYEFIITQRGEGFRTDWTVEAIPLATTK